MPTISLPPRCDRAVAQAVLPQILAAQNAATQEGGLTIDARACTAIGQAMLQVLISARRTGAGAVIDGSDHLHDTASRLALTTDLFGDIAPI